MQIYKILPWMVCCLLLFSACSSRNAAASSQEAALPPQSSEETAPAPNDAYYPVTAPYQWLDGGQTLAVPENNTIRFLNVKNEVTGTVTLPVPPVLDSIRYVFSDTHIFSAGAYDETGAPYSLIACFDGTAWTLANGSIFNRDGTLIKEFLTFTETPDEVPTITGRLSDGRDISQWEDLSFLTPYWINSDLVALDGHSRLFFYRLSTDTLTLVDDMHDWMSAYGKMQVYYGIARVIPAENGCFYFAHKNEELSNTAGTVWYADETGTKVLFDGQEFSNCFGENGVLALLHFGRDETTADIESTTFFYATEKQGALHEAITLHGSATFPQICGSDINVALQDNAAPQKATFYTIDTTDGSLSMYEPSIERNQQYEFLRTRRENGSLQWFYSSFDGENTSYYRYDTNTETNIPLQMSLPLYDRYKCFSPASTHFIEQEADDGENIQHIRIRPLD